MKSIADASFKRRCRQRSGQAMIEFLLVAIAMILLCTIMGVFLYTFQENSGRTLDHVASEYP